MPANIKSGIGFIIPFGAVIGFVLSVIAENYLLGIFFAVAGILVWLLYLTLMDTATPDTMGNFIILFGVLLSLAVFMNAITPVTSTKSADWQNPCRGWRFS